MLDGVFLRAYLIYFDFIINLGLTLRSFNCNLE